ncbi:MAG: ATP-binding protein [Oscillospiraceae bacterium]
MPFDKKYYEIAQERLDYRVINNKQIADNRRVEIHTKLPRYSELECKLADTMTRIIGALSERVDNSEELVQQAIKSNSLIQQEMTQLLVDNGYPADYLDPVYTCPKCKDKGNVDGKWCDCFKKILQTIAAENLNATSPLQLSDFDTFRLDFYSDKVDPNTGATHRQIMQNNLNECISYAENFNGKGKGLLMMGGTGLGKTHLSLAIANRVISRGFCVAYGSVPELIRKLDKEQFGKAEGDTMSLLTECDLLILDDLGAENSTDHAVSILYEIVNARQNRNAPMVINTNLDMDKIQTHYQDRLYSRLFSLKVLLFFGNDNRLKVAE